MATWECANCDHATDDREMAAQHLTECEGVGEYPDKLDPLPYANRVTGTRYPDVSVAFYFTGQDKPGDLWEFSPGPGYVQDHGAYGA
jgi:hypothetical protein